MYLVWMNILTWSKEEIELIDVNVVGASVTATYTKNDYIEECRCYVDWLVQERRNCIANARFLALTSRCEANLPIVKPFTPGPLSVFTPTCDTYCQLEYCSLCRFNQSNLVVPVALNCANTAMEPTLYISIRTFPRKILFVTHWCRDSD